MNLTQQQAHRFLPWIFGLVGRFIAYCLLKPTEEKASKAGFKNLLARNVILRSKPLAIATPFSNLTPVVTIVMTSTILNKHEFDTNSRKRFNHILNSTTYIPFSISLGTFTAQGFPPTRLNTDVPSKKQDSIPLIPPNHTGLIIFASETCCV